MNKVVIAVVVIILVGAGAWLFIGGESDVMNEVKVEEENAEVSSVPETKETIQTSSPKTHVPSDLVLSASFSCKNGSYFIAEFATSTSVNIIVDGQLIRTVASVEGEGQRYEDASRLYVFVGEEATLTNKTNNTTTTCIQPFDPNNAPVNFGDDGEGAGVAQDAKVAIRENILGKWQSDDDATFIREFKNGSVIEWRNNEVITQGTWRVFTEADEVETSFSQADDEIYVQIVINKEEAKVRTYRINMLTPEILTLTYMEEGGTTAFKPYTGITY